MKIPEFLAFRDAALISLALNILEVEIHDNAAIQYLELLLVVLGYGVTLAYSIGNVFETRIASIRRSFAALKSTDQCIAPLEEILVGSITSLVTLPSPEIPLPELHNPRSTRSRSNEREPTLRRRPERQYNSF